MRKFVCTILSLVILLGLLVHPTIGNAESEQIRIEDPALEQAIKKELKITDRELKKEDMLQLKSLFPQGGTKIKSLNGLEAAVNMQRLFLPKNEIKDLTPLRDLDKIVFLALDNNQIEDVCPITQLTSLTTLNISGNKISQFGCIGNLKKITDLLADNNQFTDLTGIDKLKSLRWANLSNNRITDISPLASLTKLEHIYLDNNAVKDMTPLLNIPLLFDVHVQGNPSGANSDMAITKLLKRGAAVNQTGKAPTKPAAISVLVDEKRVDFDQVPFLDSGSTLVQFRPLFERLGLSVQWDAGTRTITGTKQGLKLELQIDNTTARVNGQAVDLPVAPKLVGDNTFIPTRFVGETLKYDVVWDGSKDAVRIYTSSQTFMSPDGKSSLQAGHEWKSQTPTNKNFQIQIKHPNQGQIGFGRVSKASLIKGITLDELIELTKNSIKDIRVTTKDTTPKSINGLPAMSFGYTFKSGDEEAFAFLTLIEGDDSFYQIVSAGPSLESIQALEKVESTFKVHLSIDEQHQLRFGDFTAKARMLDAARYYRDKGFFSAWSKLSNIEFEAKFLQFYQDRKFDKNPDEDPFHADNEYFIYSDAFVLGLDTERVWFTNTEADVKEGSKAYNGMLDKLSKLSQGKFNPTQVEEKWVTEDGPLRVEFMLNGKQQMIHPTYYEEYLDESVIYDLNEMIKDSGYMFATVWVEEGIMVTWLKQEEKTQIEKDRLMPFESETND